MKFAFKPLLIIIAIRLLLSQALAGPTILQGNVSGTWDVAGSPYILVDECIVPTGEILVVDPGVEVLIADSMSLNVNGQILAIGTGEQPIAFRASSGQYNRIYVFNGSSSPPISEFSYCTFSDAVNALYIHAYGRIDNSYTILETIITNCTFDSSETAVYVRAQAVDASQYMTPRRRHARVNPTISSCQFNNNINGISVYTQGAGSSWYSHGTTETLIENCYYRNQTQAAVVTLPGSLNSGTIKLINNTIQNQGGGRGILVQDGDHNAVIKNNIFYGTATAIERTGTQSGDTFYNCLFNNVTNFVGYPATYGDIVMVNINGTPCDVGQNIFINPNFVSLNDVHLNGDSPCIDAATDEDAPVNDLDGEIRPLMIRYDIGADEYIETLHITQQPQSQTIFVDQDVTFGVEAVGYDLYYQWYFGGSELTGQTNDTLELLSVDYADAGNYYCAVSNAYDIVNSSTANLRVTEIGLNIAMHAGLHMTNLNIGTTYSIQSVLSLTDTNWSEIISFEAAADNNVWYDPEPANQQSKFYQVLSLP